MTRLLPFATLFCSRPICQVRVNQPAEGMVLVLESTLLPGQNVSQPCVPDTAPLLEWKLAGVHGFDDSLTPHSLHLANLVHSEPSREFRFGCRRRRGVHVEGSRLWLLGKRSLSREVEPHPGGSTGSTGCVGWRSFVLISLPAHPVFKRQPRKPPTHAAQGRKDVLASQVR